MRKPRMSLGAWIFASVVAAGVLVPSGAYAAGQFVTIVGPGNNQANVNKAQQLLTGPANPSRYVNVVGDLFGDGVCDDFYTVPAGTALVVTSVEYFTFGAVGQPQQAILYGQAGCAGSFLSAGTTTEATDTIHLNFGPAGLTVPSGGVLSARTNETSGTVYVHGYLVSAAAVPSAPAAAKTGGSTVRTPQG